MALSKAASSVRKPAMGVVRKGRVWLKPAKLLASTAMSAAPPGCASACRAASMSAELWVRNAGAKRGEAGSMSRLACVSRDTSVAPSSSMTVRVKLPSGLGVL